MKRSCVLNVDNISTTMRTIILALNIPTCVVAIIGNLVVLSVILLNRELRIRPNLLICYLAVTDMAVGMVLQPLLSVHLYYDLSKDDCFVDDAVYFLTSVICGASCLTLVLISYDRYLHLVKLFKYQSIMTKRKHYILAVSCWIVPIVEGCFLFDHATVNVFFVLIILSTVCDAMVMLICYRKIYAFIRKMSKLRSSIAGGESNERQQLKANSRLAKCFFMLVASFVVFWTPLKIILIYITIGSIFGVGISALDPYIDTLHCVAILIGIFNSCWNPVIYFMKNKALKEKTKKVMLEMICRVSLKKDGCTRETVGEDTGAL